MEKYREYYQVVTKDRAHYFSERSTFEESAEHLKDLSKSEEPYCNYEYEILQVIEWKSERVVSNGALLTFIPE